MADAIVEIGQITLTSSQVGISFTNIPSIYKDLKLVYVGTVTSTGDITFRFNGDNAANYSRLYMFGNGSTTASGSNAESYLWYGVTGEQSVSTLEIVDYSSTDKHKSMFARGSVNNFGANATVGRWASYSAINSLTINVSAAAGAIVTLYGVLA